MSLVGCVDSLTDTCISGWAANDTDFAGTVHIDVVVNSRMVASVPCAQFREDLRAAGIGDGCKGFEFDPDAHLSPGRNTLEVRFSGTEVMVPRGRGCWVKKRGGAESDFYTSLIAAIEAYHEFRPTDHIYAVGASPRDFEKALRQTQAPFGKLAGPEGADLIVSLDTNSVASRRDAGGEARRESILDPHGVWKVFSFLTDVPASAGPVLAHIHVPKCAGTSYRILMERYFGPRHARLYVNDTYFVYDDATLRSYLMQYPEVRGFSSHHVRSFPHWLAGREMLYVTFLRDPIEQFVSYMTHVKKLYSAITAKSLLEAVPPDAPRLSLREFARWLLTRDRVVPFRENHNVNFFTRHSMPDAADRLEAAKAILGRFFFVGIAERMEESMCKLRTLAQAAGLDFPLDPPPFENTSSDYRDDLSWIHPGDEVGAMLLRSVELDRELYNWALARFSA